MEDQEVNLEQLYPYADEIKSLIAGDANRTAASLAREIGVADSALSQYINKVYHTRKGNPQGISTKYERWRLLQNERQQDNIFEVPIVDLNITRRIGTFIRIAHRLKQNGLIWGPSGVGKTEGLLAYMRQEPQAVLITGRPSTRSVRGFIGQLYGAVKRRNFKDTAASGTDEIISALRKSDRIILVDQAHDYSFETLREMQSIFNETAVPFVLCGTDVIYDRLEDPRHRQILSEMARRITIKRQLTLRPDDGSERKEYLQDLETICKLYGAQSKTVLEYMDRKTPYGGIGIVCAVLKNARLMAGSGEITMNHILEAETYTELKEAR